MAVEVVMPQMGESIAEGTITKWHKKPGDAVTRDEPLFEITTDKVDTEVPSPITGVLQSISVAEDETVAVGTVVAVIAEEGAEAERTPAAPAETSTPAEPPAPAAAKGHFQDSHQPRTFVRREAPSATSTPPTPPDEADRSARLSPAVASLAARHEVSIEELRTIDGSGRGGRVTKRDLQAYLAQRPDPSQAPGVTEEAAPAVAVPAPTASSAIAEVPETFLYRPEADDRLVPMTEMQLQVADHMMWSQRVSAQVTSFAECDVHRIARYRDESAASFEADEGIPLTFLPFVAVATVRALKEFPIFNASLAGDQIAYKRNVHLGVTVSTARGLIAPVVRNADEMNFTGLARSLHTAERKALEQGLSPEDVRGASFSVTSPGLFGGLMGTPMIPQPQLATLALGGVQKKPVVVDDAIAIRPIMAVALTFDHRVIDGATAARFLESLRGHLENAEPPDA